MKKNPNQKYYSIQPIISTGSNIIIIVGERSNGKSYQAKHKCAVLPYLQDTIEYFSDIEEKDGKINENILKEAVTKGRRFILLRRWDKDITASYVNQYFQDVDIKTLTENKYNNIVAWQGKIYLAFYDEEKNKNIKGDLIGYYMGLSVEQRYASASYLDVSYIIFEEFMARGSYIKDEPNKLMNLYATVDRKRNKTKLIMLGNSITKINPYLHDWGLDEMLNGMKQGEIKSKYMYAGDTNGKKEYVKISLEFCMSSGKTSYIIGTHEAMLNSGEFQTDPQPHLQDSYNNYDKLFRVIFYYKNYKFIGEFLKNKSNKNLCWFIKPYKGKINSKTLVFSDIIRISQYWQKDIYNPTLLNENLRRVLSTFKENMIFYANDEVGTNFKQAIDFIIRK